MHTDSLTHLQTELFHLHREKIQHVEIIMATTTVPHRDDTLTRLDAAHALLSASSNAFHNRSIYDSKMTSSSTNRVPHGFSNPSPSKYSSISWNEPLNTESTKLTRQRASSGLDALALLASRASELSSSFVDDDRDSMPPPPPRVRKGRMRSASNPEGMEKWDSLYQNRSSSRMHFLLPSTILEEELQNANDACEAHEKLMLESEPTTTRYGFTDFSLTSRPEYNQGDEKYIGTSPHTVDDFPAVGKKSSQRKGKKTWKKLQQEEGGEENDEEDEVTEEDEANLGPAELLQGRGIDCLRTCHWSLDLKRVILSFHICLRNTKRYVLDICINIFDHL
jgi:hypothetical protein